MKVSICFLTFVLVSLLANTSNSALLTLNADLSASTLISTSTTIDAELKVPADVEIESAASAQRKAFIPQTVQSISDAIAK